MAKNVAVRCDRCRARRSRFADNGLCLACTRFSVPPNAGSATKLKPDYRQESPPRLPVSEIFRRYRAEHGLSQWQLADLLHLDQSYVSRLEAGKRHLTDIRELIHVAKRLRIEPEQLGVVDPNTGAVPASHLDPVRALSVIRLARKQRTLGQPLAALRELEAVEQPIFDLAVTRPSDEHNVLLAELLLARAWVSCELLPENQLHKPVQDMSQAFALVKKDRLDLPSAYILGSVGNLLRMNDRLEDSMPVFHRALSCRTEPEETVSNAALLARASSALHDGEEFHAAIRLARESLEYCSRSSSLVNDFALTEIEVRGLARLGDTHSAIRVLDRRDRAAELVASPQWRIIFSITHAEVLGADGWNSEANDLLYEAARAAASMKLPHQLSRVMRLCHRLLPSYPELRNTLELTETALAP